MSASIAASLQQADVIRVVTSLASPQHRRPMLADRALIAQADRLLGSGPLGWVAEVADACTGHILEHRGTKLDAEVITRGNEDMLLVMLVELMGETPIPAGVGVAQPEIISGVVGSGTPLEVCVATIRFMQQFWVERILAHAEAAGAPPDVQQNIVLRTTQSMDRFLDHQIQDYLAEQDRVRVGMEQRRAGVIEDLVGGRPPEPDLARECLGVDLADRHVAMVATTDDLSLRGVDGLRGCVRGVLRVVDPSVVVCHEPSKGWLWLWLSGPDAIDTAAVPTAVAGAERIRIGIGTPHTGPDGFRRSHVEAVDAERLARFGLGGQVLAYSDVALTALLCQDQERARWFVDEHLGPLAEGGNDNRELRETLFHYYGSQMRAAATAARLGVHRNTLIPRLRRAEALLGHPVTQRVPEVMCAMLILDQITGAGLDGPGSVSSRCTTQ